MKQVTIIFDNKIIDERNFKNLPIDSKQTIEKHFKNLVNSDDKFYFEDVDFIAREDNFVSNPNL